MIAFMRRYRRGLQGRLLLVIATFVASLFVFGTADRGKARKATPSPPSTVETGSAAASTQKRYQSVLILLAVQPRPPVAELAEQLGLPQARGGRDGDQAGHRPARGRRGPGPHRREFNATVHAMREFQDNGRF